MTRIPTPPPVHYPYVRRTLAFLLPQLRNLELLIADDTKRLRILESSVIPGCLVQLTRLRAQLLQRAVPGPYQP